MTTANHLLYALLWLSFGAGHSLLAGATARLGLGRRFGRWHRVGYNLIAATHLAIVYLSGSMLLGGGSTPPFLPPSGRYALDALGLLGGILLLVAVRGYNLAMFAGTAQVRGDEEDSRDDLRISGLNRFVRHPIYFATLLLLWSGARSSFGVATAVWGTCYIVIGSHLEERRLLARYGDQYARYRARVPALLPWRVRRD